MGIALSATIWKTRSQLTNTPLYTDEQLVKTVADLEAKIIHAPTGTQDYWAAVKGGVNMITYRFGHTQVVPLPVDDYQDLEQRMIVAYSGVSRQSAINNWEVFKQVFEFAQSCASDGRTNVVCNVSRPIGLLVS